MKEEEEDAEKGRAYLVVRDISFIFSNSVSNSESVIKDLITGKHYVISYVTHQNF